MLVSKISGELLEQKEIQFITKERELMALVNYLAGSPRLRVELDKLKVSYVKVERGASTRFILRHKDLKNGKLIIKL